MVHIQAHVNQVQTGNGIKAGFVPLATPRLCRSLLQATADTSLT